MSLFEDEGVAINTLNKINAIIHAAKSTYPIEIVFSEIMHNRKHDSLNNDILLMCVNNAFGVENIREHALKTVAYGIIGLLAVEYKHQGINQTRIAEKLSITRVHLNKTAKKLREEVGKDKLSLQAQYLERCRVEITNYIAMQTLQYLKNQEQQYV